MPTGFDYESQPGCMGYRPMAERVQPIDPDPPTWDELRKSPYFKDALRQTRPTEDDYYSRTDVAKKIAEIKQYIETGVLDANLRPIGPTETQVRKHEAEQIVVIAGAKSSFCHDYAQIPRSTIDRLAGRLELGAKKHGRNNWHKGLSDREYVLYRLNHIIRHCFTLAQKLQGTAQFDGDDDIGAILWGGMFLAEADARHNYTDCNPNGADVQEAA